jgi:hypothetical protein
MLRTVIDNAAAHERLLEAMLADVPPPQMCTQPPGLPNHPAWLVGHLAVMRSYVAKALGREAHVPEAWAALFNRGTSPTGELSRYPEKSELFATFKRLNTAALEALAATPPARLAEESPAAGLRPIFPTVGHLVLGLLTLHDGLHLGQLGDWRRAMGLPRVL